MPPEVITAQGATTAERKHLKNGVRQARHEMLVSSEPRLRQCYDYIEKAREDEPHSLFYLYKFVETLEEAFGGQAKMSNALNVKKSVKELKELANKSSYDERHPPKMSDEVKHLSTGERVAAINYAYEILRAYEGYLLLASSRSGG
jgi:hypothetical protein